MHFLIHWTGLDNASGKQYLFWSGFAGDIPMFGIFAVLYKKHNCHEPSCWRIGLHRIEDTPYIVCRKHLIQRKK